MKKEELLLKKLFIFLIQLIDVRTGNYKKQKDDTEYIKSIFKSYEKL